MSATFTATERLWDPATETLAYGPGADVPTSERPRLIGDAEWSKRRAVPDTSDPRGYRIEGEPKPRKAAKKTAARKTATRRRG